MPAGQDDGGFREILGEAIDSGLSSFLTLGPHLGPTFGETPEARFDCAATSLHDLLAER